MISLLILKKIINIKLIKYLIMLLLLLCPILVIIISIFRFIKKDFCNGKHRYTRNEIYTYSDFIKKDFKKINGIVLSKFILVWSIHKIILKIQILVFLDSLIIISGQYLYKNSFQKNIKFENIILKTLIEYPYSYAKLLFYKIIIFKDITKKDFKNLYLNLIFVYSGLNSRWLINNCLEILEILENIKKSEQPLMRKEHLKYILLTFKKNSEILNKLTHIYNKTKRKI